MRTLKLLVATGLALASVAAVASPVPGTGIQGTRHDWSGAITTNPTTGVATGGGQSLLVYCPAAGCATTLNTAVGPLNGLPTNATTYAAAGYVPYNVTTTNPTTGVTTTAQASVRMQFGLCTKCHTPHQARSTNLLWNHTLLATNYSWDQPKTTAGTNYPTFVGDSYKGPSTKCLSCHDGTMASTDGVWFKRQRVSGSKYVGSGPTSGHEVTVPDSGNLSGSHPVAFPYPLNGTSNSYNGTSNGTELVGAEFVADPTVNGIRLFNDAGGNITAGKVAGSTGMECTSCHDVHNGARVKDVMLLTGLVAGSDTAAGGYICTQCHKK
jgi:Doubled CXXCH motif (Paired_CXXCH_1)